MRVLAALALLGAGDLTAQDVPDTLPAPADTLRMAPDTLRPVLPDTLGPVPSDTLRPPPAEGLAPVPVDRWCPIPADRPSVLADTLAGQAPSVLADTLGGDTLRSLPDTTLAKIRARTPLFPEDVDPYTPLGLGCPARVLERDDLRAWPMETLADLLPLILPLAIEDQGGPGFMQAIRFPSGPSAATRLLVDGRPMESPFDLATDLRAVPIEAVERIEIHPGAAAVPGGAEAGWVNVVTRTHLTPQANSSLLFELGSFNREGFGAALGRFLGRRLSAFGSLQFHDGDTFTQVANADRSRFWTKARYYLSRGHFVEAAYGTSQMTTDTRLTEPAGPSPFAAAEDRRERRFQALYEGELGPVLATARYFSDRFEERESFTLDDDPQVLGRFDRRGLLARVRVGVGGGRAEVGLEWQRDELASEDSLFRDADGAPLADSVGSGFTAPLDRTAVVFGAERTFERLLLAAHARLERFDREPDPVTEPAIGIEARYAAPGGLAPFARFGRSVRHPTFVEQAVLARAAGPLVVRVATGRELRAGVAWTRNGITAELAGFDRQGRDAAVWLPPTGWRAADGSEVVRIGGTGFGDLLPGEFGELNLLDLSARGLDLAAGMGLPFGVRGEVAGRLQRVEDEAGARLPYTAGGYAVGRLVYENRFFPSRNLRVRAVLGTRIEGDRRTLAGETLPAYALLDGVLRVQLIGFTFGLAAHNLLDLRYRTEERFFLPGRVIGFEAHWEFWN